MVGFLFAGFTSLSRKLLTQDDVEPFNLHWLMNIENRIFAEIALLNIQLFSPPAYNDDHPTNWNNRREPQFQIGKCHPGKMYIAAAE